MFEKSIILVFTALLGGLVGSYISGYGHRRKALWDLRFAAYQKLTDALSGLHIYYRGVSNEISIKLDEGGHISPPNQEMFNIAQNELNHAAGVGRILFSKEVKDTLTSLTDFMNSYDYDKFDIDEYEGFNSACSSRVTECLDFVIEQSVADLDLKPNLKSVFNNFIEFIKG